MTSWSDESTVTSEWWIDLKDNLQLEAIVDENGKPIGLGEIDVESGMQKIITTGVDNTTSWSDE
jgi:hypothetical protein